MRPFLGKNYIKRTTTRNTIAHVTVVLTRMLLKLEKKNYVSSNLRRWRITMYVGNHVCMYHLSPIRRLPSIWESKTLLYLRCVWRWMRSKVYNFKSKSEWESFLLWCCLWRSWGGVSVGRGRFLSSVTFIEKYLKFKKEATLKTNEYIKKNKFYSSNW